MENKGSHPLIFLLGIILLLSLACKLPTFTSSNSKNAESTDAAKIQKTGTEKRPAEIYQSALGKTISTDGIEIFVPSKSNEEIPSITAKPVSDSLPPAPEESTTVGVAYEITTDEKLSTPVLISIKYDPANLSPNVDEANLYIATKVGDHWEVVPDGFVDIQNQTVNASVEHFSIYSVFQSMKEVVYDTIQTAVGDEITSEYFGDLPDQIRHDFYELQIKPQDITAVVHAKLSLATKTASGVISLGNLASKIAGLAIGTIESTEAMTFAAGELILAEIGDRATGTQAGSFIVSIYDSFDLGKEIGKYVYKLKDADPNKAAAMASAWILAREMEYINANLDPAMENLWKFNSFSGSRLEVYAVYFDAVPWLEGLGYGASGVRFYYYDEDEKQWINYHNDVFTWKMTFNPKETDDDAAHLSKLTNTPDNTPPQPSPSPKPTSTKEQTATATSPISGNIYVAADGSGDYPTIQDAIDAAKPGATIFLDSGTYHENLEVNKSITLVGTRKDLVEIFSDGENVIKFTGNGLLTIEDVTIQGTNKHTGLNIQSGEFKLRNIRVRIEKGTGIYIQASTGIIQNSEISGKGSYCIHLVNQSDVTIEQNLISNCAFGLLIEEDANVFVHHNEIRGHEDGIYAEEAIAIIEDNIITENGDNSILIFESYVEIRRNDCSRNGYTGIIIYNNTSDAIIEDNQCNYNGNNGIYLGGDFNGLIQGNECAWNEVNGIEITEDGNITLGVNNCYNNGNKDVVDWRDD